MSESLIPTEAELEILHIVWQQQSSTVRSVHEVLNKEKQTGYTTTLKLMQIMTEKGLLRRDTSQRQHIYQAALPREKVQQSLLTRLLNYAFMGSARQLVMQVLGQSTTNAEDRKAIKALIEQMEKESKEQGSC